MRPIQEIHWTRTVPRAYEDRMIEQTTLSWNGLALAGTLYLPERASGRVAATVSASGFGGVKEMVLPAFAERLADVGIATLIFDYAGFGGSGGAPRQHVDPIAQIEQIKCALDHLAADPRVDPKRLGAWGPSMAGGHTLCLAATEPRVRCAVAIVPFISSQGSEPDPNLIARVLSDAEARGRGEPGGMVASAGRPGELAVMNSDGAWAWSKRMTADAPNFRNEITLASLLEVGNYRPGELAAEIKVPLRVILAADDTITPAANVREALAPVRDLDVVEYPDTHFELFEEHGEAAQHATAEWFLRHLM